MLRVHVCEDNEKQRERMEKTIKKAIKKKDLDMQIGIVTDNPEDMLERVPKEKETGVFFLDIDLNHQMNGMELAEKIRKYQPRCMIIFVTTHSEMAYMTFVYKTEAMDFILKDSYEDLKCRICQCLIRAEKVFTNPEDTERKVYQAKAGSKVTEIPYDDIIFFKTDSNRKKVVLYAKNRLMDLSGNLKDIEKNLDKRFYRCHRSCLVNKDYVAGIDEENSVVIMKDGAKCPVSVRRGKGLRKSLMS